MAAGRLTHQQMCECPAHFGKAQPAILRSSPRRARASKYRSCLIVKFAITSSYHIVRKIQLEIMKCDRYINTTLRAILTYGRSDDGRKQRKRQRRMPCRTWRQHRHGRDVRAHGRGVPATSLPGARYSASSNVFVQQHASPYLLDHQLCGRSIGLW